MSIEFQTHSDCSACTLCETATNRGIPTRCYYSGGHSTALLVVGEAPGYHEDREGTSWIGRTGALLSKYIEAIGFKKYTDIYLANCNRCRPPQNADPNITQMNACRPHLQADLDLLKQQYSKVIILCLGKYATTSVTKQSQLRSGFSKQGQLLSSFINGLTGDDTPVFFTYHPAVLFRRPQLVNVLESHFILLQRYLEGDFIPYNITVNPEVGAPVPCKLPAFVPIVALDIETYGILKGTNQSVFHPVKSEAIDGVPLGKQVISVSFGYRDGTAPTGYRTFVYNPSCRNHLIRIRQWFELISKQSVTLLGQNLKFDLLYLYFNHPILSYWISPIHLTIDDTLVASFLYHEQRPEKGLKELATLFGLTDYNRLAVTSKSGRATGPTDPNLYYYNCLDVATTLALYSYTREMIGKRYGPDSPKLSYVCASLCNQILWDAINLEMNGCSFTLPKLREIHKEYSQLCDEMVESASQHNLIIKGTGSDASCRKFMFDALTEVGLLHNPQVKLTEKKQELSVGKDNFNLLLEHSTPAHRYWEPLQFLKNYHIASKMVSSYTAKLLPEVETKKQGEGIITLTGDEGVTYPSWYCIPSYTQHYGDTTGSGGTIQARFSARNPAAQTFPPPIMACLCSRWIGGQIVSYDLSQIELRIAGFLSNDPVMLDEYRRGIDRHEVTGLFVYPEVDPNSPEFRADGGPRDAGKTLNFLVIYRGGALKYQETMMKDYGLYVPLAKCQQSIAYFNKRYPVFREWQDTNIEFVRKHGYLELPTGWSRQWGTGKGASDSVSEICDFPIQVIAAQLLQSAHYAMLCDFIRLGLHSCFILQIHDALYLDVFPGESKIIDEIARKHLTHPPLLTILENQMNRTIPITYEKEVKHVMEA